MLDVLRSWNRRRWLTAAAMSVVSALVLGLPTDVIANPVFGRQGTPVEWWAYPVLVVTAALSGLLFATYVRNDDVQSQSGQQLDRSGRMGGIGGLLSFFAIGCPICNKLVVIALGTAGALGWFAPVQPYLGVISLCLIALALRQRLQGEISCPVKQPTGNKLV